MQPPPLHPILFFLHFETNVKMYHWMTHSYPRHVASDKLHERLLELSDRFVEVYIGKYQRPSFTKKDLAALQLDTHTHAEKDIVTFLDRMSVYLTKDIFKFISAEKDTDLVNIRDEILAEINQAKYLFTLS